MRASEEEFRKQGPEFLLKIPAAQRSENIYGLFLYRPSFALDQVSDAYHIVAWGDPILRGRLPEKLKGDDAAKCIAESIAGHFYYVLLLRNTEELIVGNSAFGILPVYYCNRGGVLFLSDNALTLGKHVRADSVSGRFVLETVLFRYPLFDSSVLEGIRLLGANSHLYFIRDNWSVRKHVSVEDMFCSDPIPWKRAAGVTADSFIEAVSGYLPDERYASALTGGFDSRTLLAAGVGLGREMTAFSFGTEESGDVRIASRVASVAGIPHSKIILGDDYVRKESFSCGRDFILNASGTATFARAHYLFSARQLALKYRYMVTGNFGSEIFRSPHFAGSVIAPNTVALFTAGTVENAIEQVIKSPEFRSLDTVSLGQAWDSLKSDLHRLPCFNPDYSELTRNQRLYVFVFEEVFRKYFGAEMVNQFRHLVNRTPFLDLNFLRVVLASRLAGVHSDFFEHNPVKRFKGQVLYAHIIRKAFPAFGELVTDKGYRPNDLIKPGGRFAIAWNYASKRLYRLKTDADPYAVRASWDYNSSKWRSLSVPRSFFVLSADGKVQTTTDREQEFRILSIATIARELSGMSPLGGQKYSLT